MSHYIKKGLYSKAEEMHELEQKLSYRATVIDFLITDQRLIIFITWFVWKARGVVFKVFVLSDQQCKTQKDIEFTNYIKTEKGSKSSHLKAGTKK